MEDNLRLSSDFFQLKKNNFNVYQEEYNSHLLYSRTFLEPLYYTVSPKKYDLWRFWIGLNRTGHMSFLTGQDRTGPDTQICRTGPARPDWLHPNIFK